MERHQYPSQVNSRNSAGVRLADAARTSLHKVLTLRIQVDFSFEGTFHCQIDLSQAPARQQVGWGIASQQEKVLACGNQTWWIIWNQWSYLFLGISVGMWHLKLGSDFEIVALPGLARVKPILGRIEQVDEDWCKWIWWNWVALIIINWI